MSFDRAAWLAEHKDELNAYWREYNHTHATERNAARRADRCANPEAYAVVAKTYKTTLNGTVTRLLKNCKRNGRKPCRIDRLRVLELWRDQAGLCAVTGLPMTLTSDRLNMTKASLDRVDSSKPYTRENVRLVCLWVNLAKSELSDSELREWCMKVVEGMKGMTVAKVNYKSAENEKAASAARRGILSIQELQDTLKAQLPQGRESACVQTKLDEARLWLSQIYMANADIQIVS